MKRQAVWCEKIFASQLCKDLYLSRICKELSKYLYLFLILSIVLVSREMQITIIGEPLIQIY